MEDTEEGVGGRKPRGRRDEIRKARCEKQNLDPPLPHNVKKNQLTITDAVNRQMISAEQAQEMKVVTKAAEQAEEKMHAASERLKVAQAQAATSRLMDMTE